MSEDKNFLSRWSRKKRAAAEISAEALAPEAKDAKQKAGAAVTAAGGTTAAKKDENEPKFDLASLPSIDSIGADTDIRPFLLPGVPAELTRAALRRVWMADPAIRDFIGLSENSWDFTKPGGVPGFDLSDPGVDVKRLAEEMFGIKREPGDKKSVETESSPTEATPVEPAKALEQPEPIADVPDHDMLTSRAEPAPEDSDRMREQGLLAVQENSDAALQHPREPEAGPLPVRKRHGRALPS